MYAYAITDVVRERFTMLITEAERTASVCSRCKTHSTMCTDRVASCLTLIFHNFNIANLLLMVPVEEF